MDMTRLLAALGLPDWSALYSPLHFNTGRIPGGGIGRRKDVSWRGAKKVASQRSRCNRRKKKRG